MLHAFRYGNTQGVKSQKMTHYLIYKITNKLNGKFYIGKHITENIDDGYMGSGLAIRRAIKKYGVENFTKEILFDVYGEDLMNFLEEAIVDEAFVAREDTYNIALGGQGGRLLLNYSPLSEETKKKISQAHKGKHLSEETIQKMLKTRQGYHHSKETRKKMSDAAKGHFVSEETKQKIGKHHRGKIISDEQKLKISHALKGRKLGPNSEEHNRKISEALRGRHHSLSEETKRKISEAGKRYWAAKKGVA